MAESELNDQEIVDSLLNKIFHTDADDSITITPEEKDILVGILCHYWELLDAEEDLLNK